MRKFLLVTFILIITASFLAFRWYENEIHTPLTIDSSYKLSIKKGQSFTSVANQLELDKVITNSQVLKLYAKQSKLASKIQAGDYLLDSNLSIISLVDKLVSGKVTLERITFPEGINFREMLLILNANENVTLTLKNKTDSEIMQAIGHPNEHPEGRFLPETYTFAKGTDDLTLLKQAYSAMQKALESAWKMKSDSSVLKSPYEALILASIIERETGVFDEQATIAGVFNSRLIKGMRLQTDPTVIYGMGDMYTGNIRRKDLETDTPYNTYTRSGLPPTPIALPGLNAIKAAVNPEDHNKLYFVATGDGDGRHYFSQTYAEHQNAVQRYLRKYRQNNR